MEIKYLGPETPYYLDSWRTFFKGFPSRATSSSVLLKLVHATSTFCLVPRPASTVCRFAEIRSLFCRFCLLSAGIFRTFSLGTGAVRELECSFSRYPPAFLPLGDFADLFRCRTASKESRLLLGFSTLERGLSFSDPWPARVFGSFDYLKRKCGSPVLLAVICVLPRPQYRSVRAASFACVLPGSRACCLVALRAASLSCVLPGNFVHACCTHLADAKH